MLASEQRLSAVLAKKPEPATPIKNRPLSGAEGSSTLRIGQVALGEELTCGFATSSGDVVHLCVGVIVMWSQLAVTRQLHTHVHVHVVVERPHMTCMTWRRWYSAPR